MQDYTTASAECHQLLHQEWEQVVDMLPVDLEKTAKATQALQRRREVRSAQDLLRLVLAYVLTDWSFRLLAAWATVRGFCCISDVALRKRLKGARKWLGGLVGTMLLPSSPELTRPQVQLRLVDATSISHPGSQGTDWRVHLSFNLGQLGLDGVEVTSASGGESLARFALRPGEISIGDRGYARRGGIGEGLANGGAVVVRIGWTSLPLEDSAGQRIALLPWLRQLPPSGLGQREVWVETASGRYRLWLIAWRFAPQVVEATRRQLRQRARKSGRTPRKETLEAAEFLMIVTNLEEKCWLAEEVLKLYRLRWQVEIAIKRLKSIWHLDQLQGKSADLAQTYLLGKLLAALLAQNLSGEVQARFPTWFEDPFQAVSLWRLDSLWFEWMQRAVIGPISLELLRKALPRLQRYLRDSPRKKRQQQLGYALNWLQRLNAPANPEDSLTIRSTEEYEMVLSSRI